MLLTSKLSIVVRHTDSLWEEIQDSPGEIYDMEDFYKQVEELREIMDKCIELEEQNDHHSQIRTGNPSRRHEDTLRGCLC